MKKIKHPYMQFEHLALWKVIKRAIEDLVENNDLELQTREEYVIGYICKAIQEQGAAQEELSV